VSTYQDMTAVQLASQLDQIAHTPAESAATGWVSMLDEATLGFWSTMPGTAVAEAQQAFGHARGSHMRSYTTERGDYDPAKWAELQSAAVNLATELLALGDYRIARCKAETGWGTCNLPLREDGTCSAAQREHLDAKEA
jgi:hypothetical protein